MAFRKGLRKDELRLPSSALHLAAVALDRAFAFNAEVNGVGTQKPDSVGVGRKVFWLVVFQGLQIRRLDTQIIRDGLKTESVRRSPPSQRASQFFRRSALGGWGLARRTGRPRRRRGGGARGSLVVAPGGGRIGDGPSSGGTCGRGLSARTRLGGSRRRGMGRTGGRSHGPTVDENEKILTKVI